MHNHGYSLRKSLVQKPALYTGVKGTVFLYNKMVNCFYERWLFWDLWTFLINYKPYFKE